MQVKKIEMSDEVKNLINDSSSISDLMDDAIKKMSRDINLKKETIIKQKLKEKTGIELDFEEELDRRFKNICVQDEEDKQTFYYNDGSIDGLRIVTFIRKEIPFNPDDFTLGYEETYY